jgi:hypothetical protein
MPEIFPTSAISSAGKWVVFIKFLFNVKSILASVGITINWISTFLVSTLFPVIAGQLGDYTFLPFAIISALLWMVMYAMLPETKGRSVEEISALLES